MTVREFRRLFVSVMWSLGYSESWSDDCRGTLLQGYAKEGGMKRFWSVEVTSVGSKASASVMRCYQVGTKPPAPEPDYDWSPVASSNHVRAEIVVPKTEEGALRIAKWVLTAFGHGPV